MSQHPGEDGRVNEYPGAGGGPVSQHPAEASTESVAPAPTEPATDGVTVDAPPPADSPLWRTVAKATPFIQAWKAIAVIAGYLVWQSLDDLQRVINASDAPILTIALWAVAIMAAIGIISLIYSWFAWKNMRYAVARLAVAQGADYLAVAVLSEAVKLREALAYNPLAKASPRIPRVASVSISSTSLILEVA